VSDEVLVWLSVWSEEQIVCIWSRWCHCHLKTPPTLASFISRLVLPFWYQLTQVVLENGPLNGCSRSNYSIQAVVRNMFCTGCMLSWPSETFLQRFPSIVHFICVDRKMNVMISSSMCRFTETYPLLKQKVCFYFYIVLYTVTKSFELV